MKRREIIKKLSAIPVARFLSMDHMFTGTDRIDPQQNLNSYENIMQEGPHQSMR